MRLLLRVDIFASLAHSICVRLSPAIIWAQKKDEVIVTVKVVDVDPASSKVSWTSTSFHYEGASSHSPTTTTTPGTQQQYVADIELFGEIIPEVGWISSLSPSLLSSLDSASFPLVSQASKFNTMARGTVLLLKKKDGSAPFWKFLYKADAGGRKFPTISADWDRWVDENGDDQEDKDFYHGFNMKDFATLPTSAGPGSLGGMDAVRAMQAGAAVDADNNDLDEDLDGAGDTGGAEKGKTSSGSKHRHRKRGGKGNKTETGSGDTSDKPGGGAEAAVPPSSSSSSTAAPPPGTSSSSSRPAQGKAPTVSRNNGRSTGNTPIQATELPGLSSSPEDLETTKKLVDFVKDEKGQVNPHKLEEAFARLITPANLRDEEEEELRDDVDDEDLEDMRATAATTTTKNTNNHKDSSSIPASPAAIPSEGRVAPVKTNSHDSSSSSVASSSGAVPGEGKDGKDGKHRSRRGGGGKGKASSSASSASDPSAVPPQT